MAGRARWFFSGFLAACAALGVTVAVVVASHGVSAKESPSVIEVWLAQRARAWAIPTGAKSLRNPIQNNSETLAEARAHWADHCATCHANDGSGGTQMGRNSWPPAPDMRLSATQNMTDGELFYIIQNGVRMTGMPAWAGSAHDEADSWKLVYFIRHLPQLTPEEKAEMQRLNPKGPEDRKEEEEEENFLRGEDKNDQSQPHHHH